MKWKYLTLVTIMFYLGLLVLLFTMTLRHVTLTWIIFGLVSFTLFSVAGLYYIFRAEAFKRLGIVLLISNSVQLIFVFTILVLYLYEETGLAIIMAAIPLSLAAFSLQKYFKERRPPVLTTHTP